MPNWYMVGIIEIVHFLPCGQRSSVVTLYTDMNAFGRSV